MILHKLHFEYGNALVRDGRKQVIQGQKQRVYSLAPFSLVNALNMSDVFLRDVRVIRHYVLDSMACHWIFDNNLLDIQRYLRIRNNVARNNCVSNGTDRAANTVNT